MRTAVVLLVVLAAASAAAQEKPAVQPAPQVQGAAPHRRRPSSTTPKAVATPS